MNFHRTFSLVSCYSRTRTDELYSRIRSYGSLYQDRGKVYHRVISCLIGQSLAPCITTSHLYDKLDEEKREICLEWNKYLFSSLSLQVTRWSERETKKSEACKIIAFLLVSQLPLCFNKLEGSERSGSVCGAEMELR